MTLSTEATAAPAAASVSFSFQFLTLLFQFDVISVLLQFQLVIWFQFGFSLVSRLVLDSLLVGGRVFFGWFLVGW